ncbi:MAG: tRNA (adenosine(37)-N6)-threonylcarbamoyltransferase complex ATPase subunit type 1 TsaE [Eubacteriales bacterium]
MQTKILEIKSDSPEETELAGAKTAATAKRMGVDFIAMFGDLGAGKTAFTRGAASVLAPGARVTSPTYAIVNEYLPNVQNEFTMPVFHFDMYRIVSDDDLDSIDFDGYLGRGMILTEWSENIAQTDSRSVFLGHNHQDRGEFEGYFGVLRGKIKCLF